MRSRDNEPASPIKRALAGPVDLYVDFYPVCCPGCGSEKTLITSTHAPIRYHRCRSCGVRFKSMKADHPPISTDERRTLLKSLRGAAAALDEAVKVLEAS